MKFDDIYFSKVHTIQETGNNIVCSHEHNQGWGIVVYELGPDPALKYFNLGMDEVSSPFARCLSKFMRGVGFAVRGHSILHGV